MEERDFFDERPEQRTHVMTCPHCGQQGEYQIEWVVRRKKAQLPLTATARVSRKRRATWCAATTRWDAKTFGAENASMWSAFSR